MRSYPKSILIKCGDYNEEEIKDLLTNKDYTLSHACYCFMTFIRGTDVLWDGVSDSREYRFYEYCPDCFGHGTWPIPLEDLS